MTLSATAAIVFLIAALPIGVFVSFSDLARLKIPNVAVGALLAWFVITGPFLFDSFEQYLWQLSHFIMLLLLGMVMNAAGVMGAGDAKFIAAAGPMVAIGDLRLIIVIYAASILGGFATHRAAKYSPLRKAVPHWKSWDSGKRFPMGFPLSMTLIGYLAIIIAVG